MMARSKHWGRVHRALSLVLTIVWVGAGATKLAGLAAFQGVLETHDVLPYGLVRWAWVLPVIEVLIGAGIFVGAGRPLRVRLLQVSAVCSILLLAVFCVYILRVDPETLKIAGCGCGGVWLLEEVLGSPTRGAIVVMDVVLGVISGALIVLPSSSSDPAVDAAS